jgi:predicted phosphodiesterase
MTVAVLCDIHGNLPALDAVLREIRRERVDQIVVGGDLIPGPLPRETITRLLDLELPVHFVYGNGELGVLAQMNAPDASAVTYWGTATGEPLPEPLRQIPRWTAQQLGPEHRSLLAGWPKTLSLDVKGLGRVMFCHATPRNETEIFFRTTPEERLLPVFHGVSASMVVCGHTHIQFDRKVGAIRVVNAGSVGMPFQQPAGAYWLLLGPDVQLRRTDYDLAAAAKRIRETSYPLVEEQAVRYVLNPPTEAEILELFKPYELTVVAHSAGASGQP